jgi:signal transduction histidine kinase
MSIKSKLMIAVVVALLLAAGGITATLITRAGVTGASNRNNAIREVTTRLVTLNVLRADYELNHSERSRIEWEAEQRRLSALLDRVSTGGSSTAASIKHLRSDNVTRGRLFAALVANYQAEASGKVDPLVGAQTEARLIGSLLALSRSSIDDANELAAVSQSDLSRALNLSTILAIIFVILLSTVIALLAYLVGSIVLSSLGKLRTGTDAVAGGDLDVRIELVRDDEIGSLAKAFNRMTVELKAHRDNLEELVDIRTEDLKSANEELDAYAHAVSHDLRSPLAAATLANSLMKDAAQDASDAELREEVSESTDAVGRNLARAHRMITGLLKVAEAGQKPHTVTEVSISELVDEVFEERKASIQAAGTRLEVDNDLGSIRADRNQMYQVFANVIGNSLRHNDSPEPMTTVRYLGQADGLHTFKVCDNGSGFGAEDIDSLFTPFFKGRGETSDTGIGLSIVYKVIRAYGGWIKAYNDDGACFEFAIPDWTDT